MVSSSSAALYRMGQPFSVWYAGRPFAVNILVLESNENAKPGSWGADSPGSAKNSHE